jgi:hypothetical protein
VKLDFSLRVDSRKEIYLATKKSALTLYFPAEERNIQFVAF